MIGAESNESTKTFYKDYQKVGDVIVPMREETYLNGQLKQVVIYRSVKLNETVEDAEFERKM